MGKKVCPKCGKEYEGLAGKRFYNFEKSLNYNGELCDNCYKQTKNGLYWIMGVIILFGAILLIGLTAEQISKNSANVANKSTIEVTVDNVNYKIIRELTKGIPMQKDRILLSIGLQITNLSKDSKICG